MIKCLIEKIFGSDPTVMTLGKIRASNGRLITHCRDCKMINVLDPKTLPYKDNMEIDVMESIVSCPSCKSSNGEDRRTVSIEVSP